MGKTAIVGEAWGREEAEQGRPFVGSSEQLLNSLLAQVGIDRRECLVTNVFNLQPQPSNNVLNLCGPKAEGLPDMPYLQRSKYVRREYAPELDRLYAEIEDFSPNLIIALGATPAWALLRTSGIKQIRGATVEGYGGFKVLPTYHPAAIMRQWKLRPIVFADLCKAKAEAEFPEVRRPYREVWVEPTLDDIDLFLREHISTADVIAADIETVADIITCIGFAPTPKVSLVIPFLDYAAKDGNYWRSHADEVAAWKLVRAILSLDRKFVFQNGLYDLHFLWRTMGIMVPGAVDDTMLLHHALQPEMEKGLAFLGSIYTNEPSWKLERKTRTIKKEG